MIDIISKIIVVFYIITSFFTVAQPANVEIIVGEVTTESTGISITCQNKTGKIMSEINSYKLEKKVDGEWESMDLVVAIPEGSYRIYPLTKVKDGFSFICHDPEGGDFATTEFKLEKGEYRLTIGYRIYEFSDGWTKAEASTVFRVEK